MLHPDQREHEKDIPVQKWGSGLYVIQKLTNLLPTKKQKLAVRAYDWLHQNLIHGTEKTKQILDEFSQKARRLAVLSTTYSGRHFQGTLLADQVRQFGPSDVAFKEVSRRHREIEDPE